eukprot:TRINITY_DN16471_c0_g1_i28.p1 TRINITY_DN16471_c0_g1~~TRINITY_DN16471_c0_g1_i28.p1  ORF type:complete len:166 (-),score=8.15 TRINITY_DN16471_c0_g1_i28:469-966(-)
MSSSLIKVHGIAIPSLMYCDDTVLCLQHPSAIASALELLDEFALMSGLKINRSKCAIIDNTNSNIPFEVPLREQVPYLGFTFYLKPHSGHNVKCTLPWIGMKWMRASINFDSVRPLHPVKHSLPWRYTNPCFLSHVEASICGSHRFGPRQQLSPSSYIAFNTLKS